MTTRFASTVLLVVLGACTGEMPPPPVLRVTSPQRGLSQEGGRIVVTGTTQPNADGDPVTNVRVNGKSATLDATGAFSIALDLPDGATMIETIATTGDGGTATEARTIQVGTRVAVGTPVEKGISASLSAESFARISAFANDKIQSLDIPSMIDTSQPLVSLGNNTTGVKLTLSKFTMGQVHIDMVPVDGALAITLTIGGLDVAATAAYKAIITSGTTTIGVKTDDIKITGNIVVSADGINGGVVTQLQQAKVTAAPLELDAGGLVGDVLELVVNNLSSTVTTFATTAAEKAMVPVINQALAQYTRAQAHLDVGGFGVGIDAAVAGARFTTAGGTLMGDLGVMIDGSESSPGFIVTPNGTPDIDPGAASLQLGLSDDLLNQMLAEVHAMNLMEVHLAQDFGYFDKIDIASKLPPMIDASGDDGLVKLVLGDMIATISSHDKPLISAAINASVQVKARSTGDGKLEITTGDIHFVINIIENTLPGSEGAPDGGVEFNVPSAATAGIDIQTKALAPFLVALPMPQLAGVSFDNLDVHADSGYLMVSADLR